jgi:hypothetical protein
MSAGAREADQAARSATLAGQRLLRMLDDARLSGDASRAACVDGKLAQANSFGRTILHRRERLLAAQQRGDGSATAHERAVIRTLSLQLRRIEREGRACVYPEVGEEGTVVTVLISPEVPREDPSLFTEDDRRRAAR